MFVNRVEFNTSSTAIKQDGNTVTQGDLRIGMVVRVDGSISNKTAATITVDEPIKGRVEQVIDANQMVVMGQLVQIDSRTRFENSVVPVVGDIAHVHGLIVSDGTLAAGYIEKRTTAASPPFAVKGLVRSHSPGAQTFAIGNLTVAYTGAVVSDMPAGNWDGRAVQVKGTACVATPVCGTLTASKVELNGPQVTTIAAAEFEGFVTAAKANGFVLGAQAVVVNSDTVYQNGVSADVAIGVKVEVEGAISNGVFTASKVVFQDDVRLEADVASVSGSQLTLRGMPGVTVRYNALTVFNGKSGINAITDLAAPDHVRIRGRASGSSIDAAEVELRSTASDPRVILQGPVSAIASPSLTILGIGVDTSTVPANGFSALGGIATSRGAFFSALSVGNTVKAQGTLGGGIVTWGDIQRED